MSHTATGIGATTYLSTQKVSLYKLGLIGTNAESFAGIWRCHWENEKAPRTSTMLATVRDVAMLITAKVC